MKRLFQTIILLGALVLTPQALAQDSRQKDYLYIPIFNREKFVQQISYQDRGKQYMNYSPRINLDSRNELKNSIRDVPLLGTFYEISTDNEPIQLCPGITFDFPRGNGLIRRLMKFLKE